MNVVKEIQRINLREITSGTWSDTGSWHAQYKNTAWIFVGNIPFDLTEGDVVCIFSQYGEIIHIELIRDHKTGKSKGFAFLQYEDQRSTILAVDNLNGADVLNRILRVDHSFGPKKQKKKEGEESEDDDQPKMNVAPEMIQVGGKEKLSTKPVDEEDPMAAYFRDKKKEKKSKKKDKSSHHNKHKSSKHEFTLAAVEKKSHRDRSESHDRSPPPQRRSNNRDDDRRSYRGRNESPKRASYRSRSRSPRRRSRSPLSPSSSSRRH